MTRYSRRFLQFIFGPFIFLKYNVKLMLLQPAFTEKTVVIRQPVEGRAHARL